MKYFCPRCLWPNYDLLLVETNGDDSQFMPFFVIHFSFLFSFSSIFSFQVAIIVLTVFSCPEETEGSSLAATTRGTR